MHLWATSNTGLASKRYRPGIRPLSGLADTSWKALLSSKEAAALAAELQARQAVQVSLQDGNTPLSQVRVEDLVDSGGRPDKGAPEPAASPSFAKVTSFSDPSGESARVPGIAPTRRLGHKFGGAVELAGSGPGRLIGRHHRAGVT